MLKRLGGGGFCKLKVLVKSTQRFGDRGLPPSLKVDGKTGGDKRTLVWGGVGSQCVS